MRVIKRDGRIVKYNSEKIILAVTKAMKSIGKVDDEIAQNVATTVTNTLNGNGELSVEDIQDKVEDALIKLGDAQLAKTYILYRAKRAEVRGFREAIGVEDTLKLGVNALALLDKRYLKSFDGKKETPSQMFRRVANHVASVEKSFGGSPDYWSKVFYNLMANQMFLPNTPCLANSGNPDLNYLFACYAFEVGDSMEEILQTAKDCGMVQKCIPKTQLINTECGVKLADDVVVGDFIITPSGYREVLKKYESGMKPIYSVRVDGVISCLGENHLVLSYANNHKVTTSFRAVKNIKSDYKVAFSNKVPNTNNYSIVGNFYFPDKINGRRNWYNNIDVPVVLTSDLMYMFGLWFGDGSKDVLRVRFTNSDRVLLDYFSTIIKTVFGLDGNISKTRNTYELCYNSKKLSSFFDFVGFLNKKDIPKFVYTCADELKFAFIEGLLDTDGSVKKQKHVCVISNKRVEPVLSVKKLLSDLGYSSYVSYEQDGASLYLYSSGVEYFRKYMHYFTDKKDKLGKISVKHCKGVTRDCEEYEYTTPEEIELVGEADTVDFEVDGHIFQVGNLVTHNSGGGVGLHLSKLRPRGDKVKTTEGIASGPIDFMRIYDTVSDVIKQGGIRRGGNLGLLLINHPDIIEFIKCKNDETRLNNFNISVAITDEFMRCVKNDSDFSLINPKDGSEVTKVNARHLFRFIAESAWRNGEPGFVFWDKIEMDNPTPKQGHLIKNLCGEQDLVPYEACVLGSINLAKFVENGQIVYNSLRKVVHHAVRFLDDVINASNYPLEAIREKVMANRKIGLGVMGFANLLLVLGIPYDSEEAEKIAEEVMDFINVEARKASARLVDDRGDFQNIGDSVITPPQRNSSLTTIAPTGSISIIAETSSGIEPIFAVVYKKTNILENNTFFEVNPIFEGIARQEGWYSQALVNKIIKNGGKVSGLPEVPEKWQKVFRTALEIPPEWHVRMQAAFQRHVNNAISKTVNLSYDATVEDVERVIKLAYDMNLKGLTVFRNQSRTKQVLETLCVECEDDVCPIPQELVSELE